MTCPSSKSWHKAVTVNIHMYLVLYFIYCFHVEGYSLAAESSILINYLVTERLYSFIIENDVSQSKSYSLHLLEYCVTGHAVHFHVQDLKSLKH